MGCGVMLQLRWQGHGGGQSAPWLLGLLCPGGSAGRAVLRAGVPAQLRCPSALHLDLPCGGRILPPWGRLQRVCRPARAPCTMAWQDPSRARCQSSSWHFPRASVSPSVRSSPGPLRTGWLALELDTFFKKNPCPGNVQRALSAQSPSRAVACSRCIELAWLRTRCPEQRGTCCPAGIGPSRQGGLLNLWQLVLPQGSSRL